MSPDLNISSRISINTPKRVVRLCTLLILLLQTSMVNFFAQNPDSIHLFIEQYEFQKAIDQIDSLSEAEYDQEIIELNITDHMGLRKYQEAILNLEKLYQDDSANVKRISELANCYQLLGNFTKAKDLYQKALITHPDNNYVVQQLANSYFKLDDFEEAGKHYMQAYDNDSTFYLSRQLAKCYENLELTDTAKYYYHIALVFYPSDFESSYRLANLYKSEKEYAKAIELTNTYLQKDSVSIKMLRLNGFLHFLNESYDTAVIRFERCMELGDVSDFVNKYLGYSYFKTGEYELAKDYLEKAYLKDTLNPDLCYTLGLACDYSVYKQLGIFYLNKTIDLVTPTPEYLSQVYQDLANANTGYYKYNDALDAYLTAFELTPNDTLLIFKIARHYDNWMKDEETALIYYRKFMDTRPENNKPLPKMPGVMVLSYYDFVEKRMAEIREKMFWEENKPK